MNIAIAENEWEQQMVGSLNENDTSAVVLMKNGQLHKRFCIGCAAVVATQFLLQVTSS